MNIRNVDCGVGFAFRWEWKWGRDPSDFNGHNTIWLGPFRLWAFW